MKITDYIGTGHPNAVTKEDLIKRTGLTERDVRRNIEEARKGGAVILNIQDGAGYFIPTPDDIELALIQYRQERSRAINILKANQTIHTWIDDVRAGRITT